MSMDRTVQRLAARDGWQCRYCGCALGYGDGEERPTKDHVFPRAWGGSDRITNLVLACEPCNTRKGAGIVNLPDRPAWWGECRHTSPAAFCDACAAP